MSRFWKYLFGFLSFLWTVVGALFLWAGQVGPDEAVANWQKWVDKPLPAWMRSDAFYWASMAVAAALVISGIVVWWRIWWRRRDLAEPLMPIIPHQEFVSFKEAATRMYEEFQKKGSIMRGAADQLSAGGPIGWCASYLLRKGIDVYGERVPSRIQERIPDIELKHLYVEKDATELHEFMGSRNPVWTNLQVHLDDLNRILAAVEGN